MSQVLGVCGYSLPLNPQNSPMDQFLQKCKPVTLVMKLAFKLISLKHQSPSKYCVILPPCVT